MSQCRAEVQLHKGVGYYLSDVYRTIYYCQASEGHNGPHIISEPGEDYYEERKENPAPSPPTPRGRRREG